MIEKLVQMLRPFFHNIVLMKMILSILPTYILIYSFPHYKGKTTVIFREAQIY